MYISMYLEKERERARARESEKVRERQRERERAGGEKESFPVCKVFGLVSHMVDL